MTECDSRESQIPVLEIEPFGSIQKMLYHVSAIFDTLTLIDIACVLHNDQSKFWD